MKTILSLAAGLLALNLTPVFGQSLTPEQQVIQIEANRLKTAPRPSGNMPRLGPMVAAGGAAAEPSALTKFNLDFPGGTPKELVAAIEEATHKPLNVIINKEDENTTIPPLKMNDVFVPQLFTALEVASRQTVTFDGSRMPGSYQQVQTSFGFKTADDLSDTSVWYFHVEKPLLPPAISEKKICQYFSLTPYLDRGFTVDDITTAIQTGWKMTGDAVTPELNYHKETKLLIAYGEQSKLQSISQVLQTLPSADQEFWRRTLERMNKMQAQIDQLKQASPASTNSPAEKSGK